jgi:hypothetical protein
VQEKILYITDQTGNTSFCKYLFPQFSNTRKQKVCTTHAIVFSTHKTFHTKLYLYLQSASFTLNKLILVNRCFPQLHHTLHLVIIAAVLHIFLLTSTKICPFVHQYKWEISALGYELPFILPSDRDKFSVCSV